MFSGSCGLWVDPYPVEAISERHFRERIHFTSWMRTRAGDVMDTDIDLPKHAQQPVIDGSKNAGHDDEASRERSREEAQR